MKKSVLPILALLLAGMTACKPTESNYKAAYDAAQQKRQAAANDPDLMLPAGALKSIDGPVKRDINGDSLYVIKEHLKFTGGVEHDFHKWNVAVASYKMPTNCAAHVSELFTKGYKAFSVENPEGKFYVIAGSFPELSDAAVFAKEYAAGKTSSDFIGLPGEPVIIEK